MKVYLASSYSRRAEMLEHAADLRAIGVEVVSRWIDGHHETRPNADEHHTRLEAARWAYEDLADIDEADTLILFTNPDGGYRRGGCKVEFGYALGRDVDCLVIGPRDDVFTCVDGVHHYDSWDVLLAEWTPFAEQLREVR